MVQLTFIPHERKKSIYTICCDDEPWREVHASIFGRTPNLPKTYVSLNEAYEVLAAAEYRCAKQYALKCLSCMSYHSTGLKKKLHEHLVSEEVSERIIQEFCEYGYLNDEEWIKQYVRTQTAAKKGPRAIAMKLVTKGLDRDEIVAHLEEVKTEDQQQLLIKKLLSSRYKSRNLADHKEKQKVIAALARRGFDFDAILAVIGDCI